MRKKNFDRTEDTAERLAKLRNKIPHDWEDLDSLDADSLKEKIVECQTNLVEQQREMANDVDFLAAKNKLATVSAPYKEAKARLTRVAEYCTLRMEELGK
jgi:hypothetical protein